MSTGIEARHARSCMSRNGGRCNCTKTFQAQVYDKRTKKQLRKTFATKSAARQWREDAIVAIRRGELSADRGLTVSEAAEEWLQQLRAGQVFNRSGDPYKPAAIRGYEHVLTTRVLPRLGHLRLREVTTPDVQRLVDALGEQGLAPATIDTAITPMKAIYRWANQRGMAAGSPARGVAKPAVRCKVRRVASPAQAGAMLTALDPADRPLWATAFYAGLRRGELIALQWADVDLAYGEIHVRRGWDAVEGEIAPKSRRGRRDVPIPAVLRDYLVEHRVAASSDQRVFASDRQVRAQAERAGKRWVARGLERLTLHDARHSYASLMIAAGVNAKALSTFMGHASIAITLDLYGHLMPGAGDEAATMLDAYLAREVGGSIVAHAVAHPEQATA